MTKRKVEKTGRSPYRKYNKTPYKYIHGDCGHHTSYKQEIKAAGGVVWSGRACTRCNVIVRAGQ